MFLPVHWLIFFLLIGVFSASVIALSAWSRAYIRGNRSYAILMLVLGGWAAAYALELTSQQMGTKLFWAKVQYFFIPLTGPMMLLFVAQLNDYAWTRNRKRVAILFILPILTSLIVWINTEWIWATIETITADTFPQYKFGYGFWGFLNIAYSWAMVSIAFFLLLRLAWKSPTLSRSEGLVLLISVLIPYSNNILHVFQINLLPSYSAVYDFTPLFLVTFGLGAAWSVFELRPYDLLPIVYHTVFENLPIPAMMLDENDRVRTVNPAAEIYFSQKASDLKGCTLRELLPADWMEAIDSAEIKYTINLELTTQKNHKTDYYDVFITPIIDQRGRNKGRLYIIQDITIAKQALLDVSKYGYELSQAVDERTAELQAVNKELIRAVRLKDEFLATISHELRTPLNTVIGTTESLLTGIYGALTTDQNRSIYRIEDSSKHLLTLINDILNMTQIEAGQFTLHIDSISVVKTSNNCLNLIQAEAEYKNITLTATYDIQQETIFADKRRLCQILLNLFSNAIKFTPAGGKIGLAVHDNKQLRQTYFDVWDNGIGIAPADQTRVFEPFIQIDSSLARQYEGTGLGLALTQKMVEMHGGTITVQSVIGHGSHFTVMLPWDSTINCVM